MGWVPTLTREQRLGDLFAVADGVRQARRAIDEARGSS
jgi:hypothetical protein